MPTVFNLAGPHLGCGSLEHRLEIGKTHGSKVLDADHSRGKVRKDGRGRDGSIFRGRPGRSGKRKGEGR